jgi:Group II intron, maturase-specific domain./Reverse transcriptase (RNA-dependent DNA polymerase).
MEERIKQYVETLKGNKRDNRSALSLIRYADNFVIIHEDLNVVLKCKEIIANWLSDIGLELKPSKTKLTHRLNELDGNVGFEFLGFPIQQHKVGNYRSASNGTFKLGFNTLITPSKAKVKTYKALIAEVIDTHKIAPQADLISKLNPIIRGWSNYSTVLSKEIFSKVDHLTSEKLRAWVRTRGKGDINKDKYWRTVGDRNWCFSTEDG